MLLSIQEKVSHFNSNLLYEMGNYFLDMKYIANILSIFSLHFFVCLSAFLHVWIPVNYFDPVTVYIIFFNMMILKLPNGRTRFHGCSTELPNTAKKTLHWTSFTIYLTLELNQINLPVLTLIVLGGGGSNWPFDAKYKKAPVFAR